jgi:serine/threonine-protein kinase
MTQAQRILNNRYELLAKIGDGGMAVVYKARDIMLNRTVAVKILRESYASDPAFLARFNREAQSAANLTHPNIVNVFDVGQEGNLHYIVMEFIEGSNLKDLIIQQAPLPTQQALEIAAEICDAIGFAHSKGLIHRDIKPQNILLTSEGKVKVTDFGIAKGYGDQNLTQTGITLGTVHYFSPEQAKGLQVQPQSDIYSIGVVLYEMTTGHIPFESDNPVALAVKHIEEAPPPPHNYNRSISPALEAIILKTLSKEPAQRYPTAAAMAQTLRSLESQSAMGTMAVQPPSQPQITPPMAPRRPASNQYGNNEIYNQPITRQPYPNNQRSSQPNNTYAPPSFSPSNDYRSTSRPNPNPNLSQARSGPTPVNRGDYGYNTQGGSNVAPLEDDFEQQPRSNGPGLGAWIIGILSLAIIIALVVAAFVVLPPLLASQPKAAPTVVPATSTSGPAVLVMVPDVKGKPETEARQILDVAKLTLGDETQDFNSNVTPGSVISQDPSSGQKVNVGTKVSLVVSKGQDLVSLPECINTNGSDAATYASKAGFQVQSILQSDDKIQQGAVIKTDPPCGPDKQYPRGSIIKFYVSAGPATPTPQPAPTLTPQVLAATTTLPPPTHAQPTATPAVKVDVPDVFNKLQADGTKILQTAGFQVSVQYWTLDDVKRNSNDPSSIAYFESAPSGVIVGMSPSPTSLTKQQADKGSVVTIGVKK